MKNAKPSLKDIEIRPLAPGDAINVISIINGGRYLLGRPSDVKDAVNAVRAGNRTCGLSVVSSGRNRLGVLSVRPFGHLTPKLRISLVVPDSGRVDDVIVAVTELLTDVIRRTYGRGWIVTDAPDCDPFTAARMRDCGWIDTVTVAGGMRRYVVAVTREANSDEPQEGKRP